MRADVVARVAAIAACLSGLACTSDDTAVGGGSVVDASIPSDAHTGTDATSDAKTADANGGRPAPGFDAAGFDATGLDSSGAIDCVGTGGTVATVSCCIQAGSFPDTCSVGACSCSPAFSTPTTVCQCPTGMCWGSSVQICTVWDGGLSPP